MAFLLVPHRRALAQRAPAPAHPRLHHGARLPLPDHYRRALALLGQIGVARAGILAVSLSALRETLGTGLLQALHQAVGPAGVGAVSLLTDIWSVLTPSQRRWVVWTQTLSLLMAFSTMIGIASIGPFFAVLGDPQMIDHTAPLRWLFRRFGFSSIRG